MSNGFWIYLGNFPLLQRCKKESRHYRHRSPNKLFRIMLDLKVTFNVERKTRLSFLVLLYVKYATTGEEAFTRVLNFQSPGVRKVLASEGCYRGNEAY